ncbi:MAG TPA: putative N-acetylmannosamine-6-phosphate 2-epimerase [Alloacidobacterium sp.]|jgi:N-acylglucosamine-6-phosphate 2-epimerase|nr:putative N-acetylmannosamine-6-phosphate 2-epimerase [Alloacidobacterium sp.]
MTSSDIFPASLKNKLIVSCQALPGDPLDHTDALRRIAISVLRGGAGGLRANGPEHIAAFRRETNLPIIGIFKRFENNEPHITPGFDDAHAISEAGADIIGMDCSSLRHASSEPWPQLLSRIRQDLRRPVLADIATFDEARAAEQAGAAAVATTMYGYTPETVGQRSINWALVEQLAKSLHVPVVLEGHVRDPEDVRRAFHLGAFAVVVGAAITQPAAITSRFVAGIPGSLNPKNST